MAITIAATADALNQYATTYSKDINQVYRLGVEFENGLSRVLTDQVYVEPNVDVTDIVQAFQCQFTPKGDAVFDSVENRLQPMKVDIQFSCDDLNKFRDSWMAEWVEDGKSLLDWTFPKYLYNEVIMPKIMEEIELKISYKGSYVAPTAGTPGLTINSADGLGTKIAQAITDGLLTPVPTGALVASTMVEQIEAFVDAFPLNLRSRAGEIWASPTRVRQYFRDYRGEFGTGNSVSGNENLDFSIDGTNIKLVPKAAMEGSNRLIFAPKGQLIVGSKKGTPFYPVIRWQEFDRTLKGLAEFDRFYGARHWANIVVNDQA